MRVTKFFAFTLFFIHLNSNFIHFYFVISTFVFCFLIDLRKTMVFTLFINHSYCCSISLIVQMIDGLYWGGRVDFRNKLKFEEHSDISVYNPCIKNSKSSVMAIVENFFRLSCYQIVHRKHIGI